MKLKYVVFASVLVAGVAHADTTPTAPEILNHVLESDPWGLGGGSVNARATLTNKSGARSELAFTARSKRLDRALSESIVKFSAPADLAGARFLQVQKKDGDDDRYLYLPELKRSRRIAGNLRTNAFMGTDMSFADLDRRDLREGDAKLTGSETLDNHDCFDLDVVPRHDSQYSHIELAIRKDNFLPLRMRLFDKSSTLLKSFTALEARRVSNQWYVSKSRMVNVQQNHTTELVLDQIAPGEVVEDGEFTVRSLEKGN
jgi:hypothetical protein